MSLRIECNCFASWPLQQWPLFSLQFDPWFGRGCCPVLGGTVSSSALQRPHVFSTWGWWERERDLSRHNKPSFRRLYRCTTLASQSRVPLVYGLEVWNCSTNIYMSVQVLRLLASVTALANLLFTVGHPSNLWTPASLALRNDAQQRTSSPPAFVMGKIKPR